MKHINRITFFLLALIIAPTILFAQNNYYAGKIRIIVNNPEIIPAEGEESSNYSFNQILQTYNITSITQPLSFANTPELQRLYELNTPNNEDSLFTALINLNSSANLFLSIEKCPIPQMISDPADYMWQLMLDNDPTNDWLWYLDIIDAPQAWDITKGNPNIKVAIIDNGIDASHPDLIGKIDPTTDFYTGNPFSPQAHGTSVATLLAAETVDAGQTANGQMASVGYNTKIMFSDGGYNSVDACLYASKILNAKIISVSWYFPSYCNNPPNSILLIEKEILDNGTSILRAAGNGPQFCNGGRLYPFSGLEDSRTIVVTSTGKDDKHYNTDPQTNGVTNSHYPEVDLCAPGYHLMAGTYNSAGGWPYYGGWGGTSQSTPIVSGTAALMYSVNSCLSSNWTQDILKHTTDPIVDAASFPGVVGAGRLNAHKAVQAAQGSYSSNIDLYVKDRLEDFGYSGSYAWGWWFDESPDIWVRNQADGFTNFENQEPEYSSSQPVYVYVRVWNKSCTVYNENDVEIPGEGLSLYWSKASSSSSWPQNWDGSQSTTGDKIGTQYIPRLESGESIIFEFQWNILNPYVHNNWASCLLARIEGITTDPITLYPNHLEYDVYNNNNVALHNVTVIDIHPGKALPIINGEEYPHGRFMYIGNSTNTSSNYDITFEEPVNEGSSSLIEESEIHIFTDSEGWAILLPSLQQNPNVEIVGDNEFIITASEVILEDLIFAANQRVPLYIGFSFLIDEITEEDTYQYVVSQRFSDSENHLTGAEHFTVKKSPRAPFDADAGSDKEIYLSDSTTINAVDISETAIYNWYDPLGNLIYSGKDAVVKPERTTTYKLEVIANTDGFKDYDEVEVVVKQYWIESITPNPANLTTSISYNIDGATSAYLMIINGFGTISNNYIINPISSQLSINISNYATGSYNVILIVDGQAIESKTLIVQ